MTKLPYQKRRAYYFDDASHSYAMNSLCNGMDPTMNGQDQKDQTSEFTQLSQLKFAVRIEFSSLMCQ